MQFKTNGTNCLSWILKKNSFTIWTVKFFCISIFSFFAYCSLGLVRLDCNAESKWQQKVSSSGRFPYEEGTTTQWARYLIWKSPRQKNSWNQINQKIFFREIAFLQVLNFFPVQKLIFGHFWNCKKWILVQKNYVIWFFGLDFFKFSGPLSTIMSCSLILITYN